MHYDLLLPRRIIFGWGRRAEIGALAADWGHRAWIVCGSRTLETSGRARELIVTLAAAKIAGEVFWTQTGEPTVADVDQAAGELRRQLDRLGPAPGHWVLGFGGGSAIDLAKAVAALITNAAGASVAEYLEGIGSGRILTAAPLPLAAIPTTAGTGSETTKNAVITSLTPAAKKSLRAPGLLPQLIVVDPELTVSVPPQVTAWTGLDALTQLLESYVSRRAQPITRAWCREGLRDLLPALRTAYLDGANRPARERLAHAALLSGMALTNSGLGMAHGVAAALGAIGNVPHGLACAVMLPATLRANYSVCKNDLAELAPLVCGRGFSYASAAALALIDAIEELSRQLHIPAKLSELGITAIQIPSIVTGSSGNSMSGNPREIDDAELTVILEQML